MSSTLPRVDGPADAELISAVRGGDIDAYGELFARHADAARRLARQLVPAADADDLVSDAFAKVLGVLQRGGGPDIAFRAYLLTAVRRLHIDKIRAGARLTTTDDLEPFDPGTPFQDTAVEGFESEAAAKAFASLPERWQLVLWHLEVEGQKPADIAPMLGMSANSVSALAYRAREGLRQAFLNQHAQEMDDDTCRWTHQHLGAYVRNGISRRDATKVEEHLDECRKCMAVYLELTEVNSNLAGILAPLLLGGAATAYLAAAGGAVTKGGLLLLVDRARDFVAANAPATAVAGVAVTAVIAGTAMLTINGNDNRTLSSADTAPGVVAPSSAADASRDPADTERRGGGNGDDAGGPVTTGPADTSGPPALVPPPGDDSTTGDPSDGPTDGDPGTPSESTSPTDNPSPTDTTSPTDNPSPTDTTSPTDNPSPTDTTSPTDNPSPTDTTSPTDNPSPTDTTSPTDNPSPTDTTSPTDNPSPTDTTSPTDNPSPTDTTSPTDNPASTDVSVSASAEAQGRWRYRVSVTVAGVNPGDSVPLQIDVKNLVFATDLGPLCTRFSDSRAVCRIDGSADLSTTLQLIAQPPPGQSAAITFTVTPAEDTPNKDTTNDTTTVELPARGEDDPGVARASGSGMTLRR